MYTSFQKVLVKFITQVYDSKIMPKPFLLVLSVFFCLLLTSSSYKASFAYSKYYLGNYGIYSTTDVLGDDDEDKDEDSDDSKDDEDKDKDEDEKNEDEKKKEEEKKSEEKNNDEDEKTEQKNKSESSKSSSKEDVEDNDKDDLDDDDDDGIEDEVEEEIEDEMDEDEIEDKSKIKVGKTEVEYEEEIKDSGKKEIKIKKETEVGKIEIELKDDGRVEIKVKSSDVTNLKPLLEQVLDSKDAQEILSVLPKEASSGSKVRISIKNKKIKIEVNSHSSSTSFPVSVDPNTRMLSVKTPSGNVIIRTLPDKASFKLISLKKLDTIADSTLEANDLNKSDEDKVVYKINGYKNVKFVGLVPVSAKVELKVGVSSGAVLSEVKPWYLNVFGFLFVQS